MQNTGGAGESSEQNLSNPWAQLDYFDYDLPEEAIAQTPADPRDSSKMLVMGTASDLQRDSAAVAHKRSSDFVSYVEPGDVVVVNSTRVMAARLNLFKPTGGAVEVLLLPKNRAEIVNADQGDDVWEALVRPSKRVPEGSVLSTESGVKAVEVLARSNEGRRMVRVAPGVIESAGKVPLPPYIHQPLADPERYQTVFAERVGSAAAPTAGLHFTEENLAQLISKGVGVEKVDLRVGLGTFRPISCDSVVDHQMHSETYEVALDTWQRIQSAKRVFAVGTTVCRTLESAAATGELSGATDLFIHRGYEWQVVDHLLTNFHVPKSSLLVMIDSFVGPRWKDLYAQALANDYRFLSLGDCMLLTRY